MPSAPNSRRPWSDADFCILSDSLADGWPRASIAQRLGRSINSVQGMARKVGLTMLRPPTVGRQIQITVTHDRWLCEVARERGVTPNTLLRIIAELSLKSPDWLDRLLDDQFEERRDV
jgi:transposase